MNTLTGKLLGWLALAALLSFNAAAATYYVNVSNTVPVSPFDSWETAATNIQDAVDVSSDGDLILVTNGFYAIGGRQTSDGISNRVVLDKPITLQSINGRQATWIDGGLSLRCAYLTSGAVLAGFTLTNGTAGGANGGGAWCASTNEQIINCLLAKNSAWDGAGVCAGTLSNCVFSGNTATDSGGGAAFSVVNFCTFTGNTAGFSGWGGGTYNCTVNNSTLSGGSAGWHGGGAAFCTLNNCVINNNSARYVGGGAVNSALNNCTVTGNKFTDASGYGGGVGWSYGAAASAVNNCIIYFNTDLYGSPNNASGGGTLSYCCITPLAGGVGNFADAPQFVNYAGGNLRLATNSLCINTGTNALVTGSMDLDGNPRLIAGFVDVGAYECQTILPVPVAPSLQATYSQVVTGLVVGFTGQIGGRPTSSRWEFGDGTIISNQLPSVSHAWNAAGNYSVVLRAYNDSYPDGLPATLTIQVTATTASYVRQTNSNPVSPYATWATAATNIQTAVDAAYVGSTIWVSNGVYQTGGRIISGGSLSNRVVVSKSVAVRSVNGPDATVIVGNRTTTATNFVNNVRCIYLAAGSALSGFTVTNGGTRASGSTVSDTSGGGIYCESSAVVVSNCVIADCFATNYGGGIYYGTLYNCKLTGNTAPNGAGAYSTKLYNSTLANNAGSTNGMYGSTGGGIYNGALNNCLLVSNLAYYGGGAYNVTLSNCTLVNNRAFFGGGTYNSTVRNSILYYNAAPNGSNYSSGTLTYCCAFPLPSGTGNFTNAPRFVDLAGGNFHLQTNSPCINAGNNAYVSGTTDLDGNPRVIGYAVDAGAYEKSPASLLPNSWLWQYGYSNDGSADFVDSDGDVLNNWQEWKSGTVPTNAVSVLKMASATNALSGLVVTWQSVSGISYYLQRSSDLAGGFTSIASNLVGQAGSTSYPDITATNAGPYFYRVGVQ